LFKQLSFFIEWTEKNLHLLMWISSCKNMDLVKQVDIWRLHS